MSLFQRASRIAATFSIPYRPKMSIIHFGGISGSHSDYPGNGEDLSSYGKQFAKERDIRSLSLRRENPNSVIGSSFKSPGRRNVLAAQDTSSDGGKDGLSAAEFVEAFGSGDARRISSILNSFARIAHNLKPGAMAGLDTPEVGEALVNALLGEMPEPVVVQILDFTAKIFPGLSEDLRMKMVDDGLTMCLLNFFDVDSMQLVLCSIQLMISMSDNCAYARDSLLCLGLHDSLLRIAQSGAMREAGDAMQESEPLTDAACSALQHMFANPAPIDLDLLSDCVDNFLPLLNLQSLTAMVSVLECFVEITNKMPSLICKLHEFGLYPLAVQLLQVPQLVQPTLRLIGNFANGQPGDVEDMLESGLLPELSKLLDSEFIGEALWIMGNLLETVSASIMPMIDGPFIQKVMVAADSGSFEVKKDAGFFIATFIFYAPAQVLGQFITEDIADLLVEIMNCEQDIMILRSIDAIAKLIKYEVSKGGEPVFVQYCLDCGFKDRLLELSERESQNISHCASSMLHEIGEA